ncbi:MAG: hypothetical protein ACKO6N_09700 [Myxococcota bacterium]
MVNRKLVVLFLAMSMALFSTGCLRKFKLEATSGPCLNPPDLYCKEDGSGSRVLEVRVYQLNSWIDPTSLTWEELLDEDSAFDFLKSYLTDAQEKSLVYTKFTLENNDEYTHKLYRMRGTKYLLVMTAGRNKGQNSILVLPIAWTQRKEALYFEYYDVKSKLKLREVISPDPNKPPEVSVP